jgi:beta-glucuronidase
VTYASDKINRDVCFDLCDIVCINRYEGWYYGNRSSWKEGSLSTIREQLGKLNVEGKPIIVSEFGAAAIYGHHTFDDLKWTEEYQADMLKQALRLFKDDPMVAGCYIWQFCDIRTAPENSLPRARHYNNKGILNEYRRPKIAYFAVRDVYKEFSE